MRSSEIKLVYDIVKTKHLNKRQRDRLFDLLTSKQVENLQKKVKHFMFTDYNIKLTEEELKDFCKDKKFINQFVDPAFNQNKKKSVLKKLGGAKKFWNRMQFVNQKNGQQQEKTSNQQ